MKCFRRCLLLLLCLVMLSGAFSVSASAETLERKPHEIFETSYLVLGKDYTKIGQFTFYPDNDSIETFEPSLNIYKTTLDSFSQRRFELQITSRHIDESIIAQSGLKTTFKLENVYSSYLLINEEGNIAQYFRDPTSIQFLIRYVDGSTLVGNAEYTLCKDGMSINVTGNITPEKDVSAVTFIMRYEIADISKFNGVSMIKVNSYLGEFDGVGKYTMTVIQPSEEAGLLSGILGSLGDGFTALKDKLSSVIDSITNGFKDMGSKLSSVITSITELPSKIWNLIETGLKNLFVPSQDYLLDYSERMEEVIDNKFGAVAEVVDITYNSWEDISLSDTTDTITVPTVSITLPGNNEFTFGGNEVKIVPDGFESIATVCKGIVAVVCTFTFINGMRKRYDEVMGVEQ